MQGKWLAILEYAHKTGKSISTLRRYIKSGKVEYKLEGGKYFILFDESNLLKTNSQANEAKELEQALKKKEDEINELKMLINLYESRLNKSEEPPEIPFN